MWLDILRIVAGLVILIVAADRLVLSAARIAKVLNVSAVVIGAVIVGFGTSLPEFTVSALAAGQGDIELALVNVIASTITNVTLVLGVGGLLVALPCHRSVIRHEGFLMMGVSVLLAGMILGGSITRIQGAVLLVSMGAALLLMLRWSKSSKAAEPVLDDLDTPRSRVGVELLLGLVALVVTVLASRVLLTGVTNVGTELGLSVAFKGLIVGVGTSLPELSAAIASARRRETDLILGNVLGSNIFNGLAVAGVATMIGPGSTEAIGAPLVSLMIAAAFLAGVFAYTQRRITRIESAVLVLIFGVYAVLSV